LRAISADHSGRRQIQSYSQQLDALSSLEKVALLDLAIPALRRLSGPAQERFIDLTRAVTQADQEVSLFEYMLQQVMERHLIRYAQGEAYARPRVRRLAQLQREQAFLHRLMERCGADEAVLTAGEIATLHDALDRCQHASSSVKQALISALHDQAQADRRMTNREAELLRATADAIGCAIPLGTIMQREGGQGV